MRTTIFAAGVLSSASSSMDDCLPMLNNSETFLNPFQVAIRKGDLDLSGWMDLIVYMGIMP